MNQILAFKKKVKAIIEKHGGEVDIDILPGVIKQPTELKRVDLPSRPYFQPVQINFDGANLSITLHGSIYSPEEAKEYLKRLEVAVNILEEIQQ